MKTDTSTFDGITLQACFHYTDHSQMLTWTKCSALAPECRYWVAVGGDCFGFTLSAEKECCLASLEQALRIGNPNSSIYVIWQCKNHSRAAWERWATKWSKRTSPAVADDIWADCSPERHARLCPEL